MNVGELREALEYLADDVEVRWAAQPHYPLEYDIDHANVVETHVFEQKQDGEEYECARCEELDDEHPEEAGKLLYLFEGGQLGYLPGIVTATDYSMWR